MKPTLYTLLICTSAIFANGCGTVPKEEIEVENAKTTYSSEISALNWLKAKQNEDGTWGEEESKDVLTPLVVLSFISPGETPSSAEYGNTVKKGIKAIVDRMDDTSRELPEPAKTITIWCFAETYGMTAIPMLKPYLEEWLKGRDFNISSPWAQWALHSCFIAGVGEEKGMEENFNAFSKYFENSPRNLLDLSSHIYASLRSKKGKENIQLFKQLWAMSPGEWRESKKPMLTALSINKVMWDAPLKQEMKWNKQFWTEIWASQIKNNNIGYWSEKTIGIGNDYAILNLSEDDKQIYITSMVIIAIPPSRRLPTFKVPTEKAEDNEEDLGLELE